MRFVDQVQQSSRCRRMHVYELQKQHGDGKAEYDIKLLGRLHKLHHRSTPDWSNVPLDPPPPPKHELDPDVFRAPLPRRSVSHALSDSDRSEASHHADAVPPRIPTPGPSNSTPSTPALGASGSQAMNPPANRSASRRSSASNAGSPIISARSARSPSPAPPLPAVRMAQSPHAPSPLALPSLNAAAPGSNEQTPTHTNFMYGSAEVTPFFRRLSWSTDGNLLLTPAGLYEDPTLVVPEEKKEVKSTTTNGTDKSEKKKAKKKESKGPKPTVYVYTRANVASAPSMHLPGHQTASIAIRFNPLLWEPREVKFRGRQVIRPVAKIELDPGKDDFMRLPTPPEADAAGPAVPIEDDAAIETAVAFEEESGGLFDLPHRMIYAVATHDCVYVYDTQQSKPVAIFSNMHVASFTDLTWCVAD